MRKLHNSLLLLLICSLLLCSLIGAPGALAQGYTEQTLQKTAVVLADSYRIMTNSDIALVSDASVRAAYSADVTDAELKRVYVKKLTGQDVFDLISTKVAEGGDSYPFFSGLRAETKTVSSDSGVRSESLEGLYVAQTPIDFEAKYTVALSGDYAAAYEAVETEAAYQPDSTQLGSYLLSFGDTVNETEAAGAEEQDSTATSNQNDGIAILHNQTTILSSALVLVAIVLAIYLIIWRKKKKDDKNDTSL